jgi:hypothetical protein
VTVNGQVAGQRLLHAVPDLATLVAVAAYGFVHLIVQTFSTELAELVVETQRQAASFRISEVVAANAGIQPAGGGFFYPYL